MQSKLRPFPAFPEFRRHHHHPFKILCCDKKNSPASGHRYLRFKLAGRSIGDYKWRFNEIDTRVQESVNRWLSRTQDFLNEVTSPLVRNVNERRPSLIQGDALDVEDSFMVDRTVDIRTPSGDLSVAAIVSVEQFSRMNGLDGRKMQKIFKALVPESIYNDARNLVEYCCFRFLSRENSAVHPSLKEPAFRRLIFITMIAWEHPYAVEKDFRAKSSDIDLIQRSKVGEEAFVRIAPAVSGVADWSTAHNLFKALAGNEQGISFSVWSTYINEILKVHEGRKSYQFQEFPRLSNERILCLGSSRKQPVLKWENNVAWPGKLTLTDKALYFEAVGQRDALRLDLTKDGTRIEKARVGPLGIDLFDSAVSVTSGPEPMPLVLEFVDLGGVMRRDVWHAFISEVIALHKFIQEFGPKDGDPSIYNVYGAQKGKSRAITYATNSIARVQALQFMRKLLDEPTKLVEFSYLQNAPYGDVVLQTLAVNCWGGQLITDSTKAEFQQGQRTRSNNEVAESSSHVFDIDGSAYLRKWMRSPSWASNASVNFWKNSSLRQGFILSKNLVVADMTLVQRAALTFRDKCRVVENTQATIDAAMVEGIPSNIDLFKELMLPLAITAQNFEKLRRWEDPLLTSSFLALAYTLILRNMLSYVFPACMMVLAAGMLLLKGLNEQGRLGRYFGKVTIRDQPPSNTIEKIIAVKEAMREVEKYLQNLNVSLLKLRSIILAGQPQITMEVALALLLGSTILLLVPFKYIFGFVLFDLFTRELNFRRQMVLRFMSFLKERWDTLPAAPVVVLPFEINSSDTEGQGKKDVNNATASERSKSSR